MFIERRGLILNGPTKVGQHQEQQDRSIEITITSYELQFVSRVIT